MASKLGKKKRRQNYEGQNHGEGDKTMLKSSFLMILPNHDSAFSEFQTVYVSMFLKQQ
jgi:hypothetical protein